MPVPAPGDAGEEISGAKGRKDLDRENVNREAQRFDGKLLKENLQKEKDNIMITIQMQKQTLFNDIGSSFREGTMQMVELVQKKSQIKHNYLWSQGMLN